MTARPDASTTQAARSFCAKLERSSGWEGLSLAQQTDAIGKARSFVSWLLVTGKLIIAAELMTHVDLRLGVVARGHRPATHAWFVAAGEQLRLQPYDVALQWNALMKATAITGISPDRLTDKDFSSAREAIITAYVNRGMPSSGRNMSAIFTRLRLTLFHCGQLSAPKRRGTKPLVTVSGWTEAPEQFTDTARRYIGQVELSLRPNTVKHIDQALREFGNWLGQNRPEVSSCADLTRSHIEDYKSWIGARHGRYTGRPLNRVSVKNRLINLHCFFDRITEWGYPNPPQRPLIFTGDLPIIDKPLPRFLDDAAAAKLMRTSRADPDPLARLIVELLARTGIRKSELLALTVDAVVQIGSAYWLRIPVGKLHNDRYIPLHPQLKDMLDDWVNHHRPTGLRSERLLLENNKPVSALRVSIGPEPAVPRGRHRARHAPPAPPHPRHPGHQPRHEHRRDRRPARPQDPRHDHDLRPDRGQNRRRGVLQRHREGRGPLRPTPTTIP